MFLLQASLLLLSDSDHIIFFENMTVFMFLMNRRIHILYSFGKNREDMYYKMCFPCFMILIGMHSNHKLSHHYKYSTLIINC